ncbi:glycosyltransferase family 2 protein [Pedobacter steynii]|uniref:Glycosyltransferase 2-like domain-containing protein n=1 Tax=Pedobacter steynii TaxID=430522 RepID=A0A1D7QNB9_9SPHI|nr:glycosyltransferase [Pedobacter steynii]AOM80154.1 hypothetical protein BFS30_25135 [Pedobacter steynii]
MLLLIILNCLFALKIVIYFFLPKKGYRSKNSAPIAAPIVNDDIEPVGVDIIVPMFNEEKVIIRTIEALRKIDYKKLCITIIDDGSEDDTLHLVRQHYEGLPNFNIIHQPNKGKAAALNNAIENSSHEIIICIDADTLVKPDLIDKLLPYFKDPRVAAVAGNIKVSNRSNLITQIQSTEYTTMYNYDRNLFESVNGILIIPGALGAFRREVVYSIGGYTSDTLAEDTELTLRILCNDYLIRNAADAEGYTEVPASLKMFIRQRIRWKVGTVQVLSSYPFSHPNKILLFLIIPYNWIFGMFLPLITPIVDYFVIYQCLFMHDFSLLPAYLCFIGIDSLICSAIILLSKERPLQILFMVFQRFLLRQLVLLTYITMVVKAFKGSLFKWEKITRYGEVQNIPETKTRPVKI